MGIFDIFNSKKEIRSSKIPFRFDNRGALIHNNIKLIARNIKDYEFELYDLLNDTTESNDISKYNTALFEDMKDDFLEWNKTVEIDIKKKKIVEPLQWRDQEKYFPFFEKWNKRKEYSWYIKREPFSVLFEK